GQAGRAVRPASPRPPGRGPASARPGRHRARQAEAVGVLRHPAGGHPQRARREERHRHRDDHERLRARHRARRVQPQLPVRRAGRRRRRPRGPVARGQPLRHRREVRRRGARRRPRRRARTATVTGRSRRPDLPERRPSMWGMVAKPQRRRPSYPVTSVDNALRLILMLRDLGEVRGREAAAELGISPSSVHRLMSMLVYRGFAVQSDSRAYHPGPSIGVPPAPVGDVRWLTELVRPHLERLSHRLGESTYFEILTGTDVRFLASFESGIPLQAGDRQGFVVPAHASAAGRAMLANLPTERLDFLYDERTGFSAAERTALDGALQTVRVRGYALSIEEIETGIVSVAVPIRVRRLEPPAAISTAGPPQRLRTISSPESIA